MWKLLCLLSCAAVAAQVSGVDMYEDGGTLVIKTGGGQGDVAIDGTRVAAALEALHQAHAALVTRFDATETKNSQLEARVSATEAKNTNLEAALAASVAELHLEHARAAKVVEQLARHFDAELTANANNATAAVAELRHDNARASKVADGNNAAQAGRVAELKQTVAGLNDTFARSEKQAAGLRATVKQLGQKQSTTSGIQIVNGTYVGTPAFCQAWGATLAAVSSTDGNETALGAGAGGSCRLPDKWLSTLVLEAWAISLVPAVRLIQGTLRIAGQHALRSLSFLARLEVVTGDVEIESNDLLESISLPNLARVGGKLRIINNKKLAKVDLPKLTHVTADITVESNDLLESISIPELARIGGRLYVRANPKLSQISLLSLQTYGSSDMDVGVDAPKLSKACHASYKGACLRFAEITNSQRSNQNLDNVPIGCTPYQPGGSWSGSDFQAVCRLMADWARTSTLSKTVLQGCGTLGDGDSGGGRCSNHKALLAFERSTSIDVWVHSSTFAWNPYRNSGSPNCNLASDGDTVGAYACRT